MKKTILARTGVAALATALCVSTFSAPAQAAATNNAIDTNSRSAVTSAYNSRYVPALSSQIGWTGAVVGCKPGTQSADSLSKSTSVINFYRGLSGLDSVKLDTALNAKAQSAALIMHANQKLDHYPESTYKCYSSAGAQGAQTSNLFGGWGSYTIRNAAVPIDAYMTDSGDNNKAAGHRRWLLNPTTTTMGVGTTSAFNAVTVIGTGSSSLRAKPSLMPFPNAGYFPQQLEPEGRWSLSSNEGADFSASTVTVKRGTTALSVTKHPVEDGYGMPNTLVFQVSGVTDAVGSAEQAYTVTVGNIKQSGRTFSHTYTVKMFDPTTSPATTPPPHTNMNPSINQTSDIVAYDAGGTLWNYGSLYTTGTPRRAIGPAGAAIPQSFFVTDWNSDYIPDLLVQHKNGSLVYRQGISTGGFSDTTIGNGWQNYTITVGKWKKTDRFPSIIARNNASGELFNYGNPSGKSLSSRVKIGNGWNGLVLNLLDWDKDGSTDIVAKNSAGQLKLYRTNGAGAFRSEARAVIGGGWNVMNSIRSVSGHNGTGTVGLVARDTSGKLYYYQANKGSWGARKVLGSGWGPYTIAGN